MAKTVVDGQTIHIGDARRMPFIGSGTVNLIMTSPPYWNLKDYGHEAQIGNGSYDAYLEDLNAVWDECHRAARPDAVLAINAGNRRHRGTFMPIGLDIRERIRNWKLWDIVIWHISNALPQPKHYTERLLDNKFEFLMLFTKGGDTNYTFHKPRVRQKYWNVDGRSGKMNLDGRCLGNIISIPAYRPPNIRSKAYHAAAYPEELAAFVLHTMTDAGDTVLDPFLGSGTTLKAARGMGRRGIGIEINGSCLPTIRRRIGETFHMPDWSGIDVISNMASR